MPVKLYCEQPLLDGGELEGAWMCVHLCVQLRGESSGMPMSFVEVEYYTIIMHKKLKGARAM